MTDLTSDPPSPAGLSYTSGAGDLPLLGDTIGANLARAVELYGDREALVDVPSGRRWTYAEFGRSVEEVALGLMAKGVAKGDRVGIWAINCPEWVLLQYATARIGAIMVNINPAYRVHELRYVLQQAGISVLVSSIEHKTSDYRRMVEQVRSACSPLRDVIYIGDRTWDGLVRAGADVPPSGSPSARPGSAATTRSTSSTPPAPRAFPRAPPSPTTTSSTTASSWGRRSATPPRTGSVCRCPSTTASAW
ncbi:hypothetical protein SSPO_029430 [Streptomyces antimycoticus]|uniref:AMP-dependent synthetase/ligase domain-containing protein n=1 Tax=Streptomyces antimycoticus TaxID=68175 RepID=A0A499UF93_9ACTN|nr:hypothetical protein SSPO_029430 [Streptomyces antimycoticus]